MSTPGCCRWRRTGHKRRWDPASRQRLGCSCCTACSTHPPAAAPCTDRKNRWPPPLNMFATTEAGIDFPEQLTAPLSFPAQRPCAPSSTANISAAVALLRHRRIFFADLGNGGDPRSERCAGSAPMLNRLVLDQWSTHALRGKKTTLLMLFSRGRPFPQRQGANRGLPRQGLRPALRSRWTTHRGCFCGIAKPAESSADPLTPLIDGPTRRDT